MEREGFGLILFPKDLERISRMVKPEYQFAVIMALSRYAETGVLPTADEISEVGMVCFDVMQEKIDRMAEKYEEKKQKSRAAINKRWNKQEAHEEQPIPKNTEVYERIPTYTDESSEYKYKNEDEDKNEDKTKDEYIYQQHDVIDDVNNVRDNVKENDRTTATAYTPIIAIDGSDLSVYMANQREAERIILRYMPPCTDAKLEAVCADIDASGIEKVTEAMKAASLGDNRGGVSINFYRACLRNLGKPKQTKASDQKQPEKDYQRRHYTDEDFKRMEVDLDAM